MQGASRRVVANVVGSYHGHGYRFAKWNARTVDAGAKATLDHIIRPGMNVGTLFRQHASTLLLIEEDDGVPGKSIALGRRDGGCRIGSADPGGIPWRPELLIFATVEQQQKPIAHSLQCTALPCPAIAPGAWRIVEPIPGKRKRLAKGCHAGITRIVVAVHSQ